MTRVLANKSMTIPPKQIFDATHERSPMDSVDTKEAEREPQPREAARTERGSQIFDATCVIEKLLEFRFLYHAGEGARFFMRRP